MYVVERGQLDALNTLVGALASPGGIAPPYLSSLGGARAGRRSRSCSRSTT
jgi:hypothetical protein